MFAPLVCVNFVRPTAINVFMMPLGESELDSPSSKEVRRFPLIQMVWRRLRWCTGSSFGRVLVLALPLAMVLGKTLNGSRECGGLLPT